MATKEYMPVRPPRVAKVSKDTSGRLMNIIAELSVSMSNDDRARQRKMKELKSDFEISQTKLISLISKKKEYLTATMETFSVISAKIKDARKIKDVKEKLMACKGALECRREDIQKLWCESLEHRDVVCFLRTIEDFSKVKDNVNNFLCEGKFEEATDLLVSKTSLFHGKLACVDGLKDVQSELNDVSDTVYQFLLKENNKNLYKILPEESVLTHIGEQTEDSKNYLYNQILSNSEEESKKQFSILLNCIYKLKKLADAIEFIKENCEKELQIIVHKSTVLISNALAENSISDQKYFLLHLLKFILSQFNFVAKNHEIFLRCLEKLKLENNITDDYNYGFGDFYSKVKSVIHVFLSKFIDLNTLRTNTPANLGSKVPPSDISSYFLRKDYSKLQKTMLFRFDCSSHAISMKSYLEEKNKEKEMEINSSHLSNHARSNLQPLLLCQPSARNITIIFIPVKEFLIDVETKFGNIIDNNGSSMSQFSLNSFLTECVRIFLNDVNAEVYKTLERNAMGFETFKLASDSELKAANIKAQILESAIHTNSSLLELLDLVTKLPDFRVHLLHLMYTILEDYKEKSNQCYKGLINPNVGDNEEKTIFSVSWAKDNDICRLLKSLPNWMNLKHDEYELNSNEFEESPSDVRYRNIAETDLLIQNLRCKDPHDVISENEILRDYTTIKKLGIMHESIEWIAGQISNLAEKLPDIPNTGQSSFFTEKFFEQDVDSKKFLNKTGLTEMVKEFYDLADSCILVLHLELRSHCFYYLLPLCRENTYVYPKDVHEPETFVTKLNSDLCAIEEALNSVLQPKKMKYVFEGLGELLSTILINSVSNIKKINENGVKRMGRNIFAIQQTLDGITMTREVALHRAKQYFDLLNLSIEDILNKIVEEGPQFQEQEYSAILQLLHNSREGMDSLSSYKEKLRQILDEVAVSV